MGPRGQERQTCTQTTTCLTQLICKDANRSSHLTSETKSAQRVKNNPETRLAGKTESKWETKGKVYMTKIHDTCDNLHISYCSLKQSVVSLKKP